MNNEDKSTLLGAPASRRRVLYEPRLAGETPALPGSFLMYRRVEPEWLDLLPSTDLRARQSRMDLRRLNRWMGHVGIAAAALRRSRHEKLPLRLTEIGAGDGNFLLNLARALGGNWRGTQATLVDRQCLLTDDTCRAFSAVGWVAQARTCDIFDWSADAQPDGRSVIVANLFLHHFESGPLRRLLAALERRASFFVAIEPRRSLFSLCFSRMVGLIGCNRVTRHDAPASVRAGFRQTELSQLWPESSEWKTWERRAGPFSHLFVARRLTD